MPSPLPVAPARPRIRAAVLGGYPELATSLGLDPLAELSQSGIDARALTQPDQMLPIEQLNRLLDHSARASGQPDFAVRLAASVSVARLGMIRFLAHGQPTVGAAFDIAARHSRFHNEALSLWVEPLDLVRIVHLDFVGRASRPMSAMVELATGVVYFNLRAMAGADWTAQRVQFRHPPPNGGEHARLFGCSVEFGQDVDTICCRTVDFERPNCLYMPEGGDRLAQLRAAGLMPQSNDIVDVVQRLICGLLPTGECSIEVVAGHLNMTSRTLHRQLGRRNETFTALLASVRREFALRHLACSDRPLTATADLLGFRSLSDFSNWFRRQFGLSPTQWVRRSERGAEIEAAPGSQS